MNMLSGYHSKNPETCQLVLDNVDTTVDNITVKLWVEHSGEYLKHLDVKDVEDSN